MVEYKYKIGDLPSQDISDVILKDLDLIIEAHQEALGQKPPETKLCEHLNSST